jgi:hypothetical protein
MQEPHVSPQPPAIGRAPARGTAPPGLSLLAGCAATPTPIAETAMQEMTASKRSRGFRSGRMSAEAYVVAMLDRAERLKSLDALISVDRAGAIAQARRIDADARERRDASGARGRADRRQGQHQQPRPAHHRRHRGAARRETGGERADAAKAGRRRSRSSSPRPTCTSSPSASPAPTSRPSPAP